MILAGDVGGTKVALALVEREDGARPELAAFGVAAPVVADRVGPFLEAFRAKGRLRRLLEDVPVSVVVDPSAPLRAARWATLAGQASW
ncbi:MAG TPA: glucokinase [Gemmatimonadota bacterium]|nr:glucokinase [Gemmatimonadota bacterium]